MRETKQKIASDLIKKIVPVLSEYGGKKLLAERAGVEYHQLGDIKRHKLALPSVIEKLKKHFGI